TNIVRLLLENGADISALDMEGATALHLASLAGHTEVVELLCAKGADVTAVNQEGSTPL
ncbi:ankyrin, partial [Colletotrichum zoysiae]